MNIPDLPFIKRLTDHPGVYVFPDKRAPSFRPGHALAGPFSDARGARLWILEMLEQQLVDARRPVWVEVCQALGTMSHDLGIEFYLIDAVIHGKTFKELAKYIPRRSGHDRREQDRRMLAAGDRGAA